MSVITKIAAERHYSQTTPNLY